MCEISPGFARTLSRPAASVRLTVLVGVGWSRRKTSAPATGLPAGSSTASVIVFPLSRQKSRSRIVSPALPVNSSLKRGSAFKVVARENGPGYDAGSFSISMPPGPAGTTSRKRPSGAGLVRKAK